MVDEQRQSCCRDDKELCSKGVVIRIVSGSELDKHEIESSIHR